MQAIGRDAAGRWQYVYHASHVRSREKAKYARLIRFGSSLPRLRRVVAHDLGSRELGRERVLAAMARILACAFLRPGSEAYAAENGSYGLATLRRRHVSVRGDTVSFTVNATGNNLFGVVVEFGDSGVDQYATSGALTARVTFKHAYTTAGTFTVRAVVTDAIAGEREATKSIVVKSSLCSKTLKSLGFSSFVLVSVRTSVPPSRPLACKARR